MLRTLFLVLNLAFAMNLVAETGYEAWLRYAPLDEAAIRQYRETLPAALSVAGDSVMIGSARQEMIRGIRGMIGRTLRLESGLPREGAVIIGTLAGIGKAAPQLSLSGTIGPEGYWLRTQAVNGARYLVVTGADERGVLYGTFALLRKLALRESILDLDER